jgi:alanine racemase
VLSTAEAVDAVLASAVARVHVKVDTGMGRWGLEAGDALEVARRLAGQGRLAGLMSHLATSEDPDPTFVEHQVRRFAAVAAEAPACPRHLANSGGVLYHPAARFDEARCGLALYGISPRDDDPIALGLVPALAWQSVVRATRVLASGESTGYARAFHADRETRIALVPVGYADGFPRRAAGRATVLIGGTTCPVVAVAMDQLAVIAPAARVDDVVTLVGADGSASATISGLARAAGTIGYEVACGLIARPARTQRLVAGGA